MPETGDSKLAAEVLARYLAGLKPGQAPDMAELCRAHPELASALRQLVSHFPTLAPPEGQATLANKLTREFGSDIDPAIALDEHDEEDESRSVGLLRRLSEHGPQSSRYLVKGEINHGGMGAILKVFDQDLRRSLAMKVILAKGKQGTPQPVDRKVLVRFLEEAQITGQLDHPGIVPLHELGLDPEGRVYFTMKLVKGRDLRTILDLVLSGEEGWNETRALSVLLKVCEAMGYAHAKGVIHRDLKPANVMVGGFGEVYVMDWGLSRVLGRKDTRDIRLTEKPLSSSSLRTDRAEERKESPESPLFTMDGDVVGTPSYMPPEQARGEIEKLSPRADVYSIGAMLYHLLARQMPYVAPSARVSSHTVLAMVLQGPPQPLHELRKDVPLELAAICDKAMARDPARRYADTQELASDLRAYLEHRVVKAYQTGAVVELRKWIERNRALSGSLAAGILAVVVGALLSLFLWRRADENAAQAEARRDEVLRLSALQKLEDLVGEADRLWPAEPHKRAAYRDWIERARELVAELPLHRSRRDELRALALPRTEEERLRERESHPLYPELRKVESALAWKRPPLLQRRDAVEVPLPSVDWNAFPSDAAALNESAWERVDPGRVLRGQEALGFALARRAVERASDAERAAHLDTLAWASFALGRDDEALEAGAAALAAAAPDRRPEFQRYLAALEKAVSEASSEAGIAKAEQELAELEARQAELDRAVDERRDWRFPPEHDEARWWEAQLSKLIPELEQLERGLLAADAVTPEHGWSVPRRLAFAERLAAGFAPGGEFARLWDAALPEIQKAHPGLALPPQLGLVPIGTDPDSGLWEFAHLASGDVPERGPDGRLALTEATGIVLVLLPGGTFTMGAQNRDRGAPHYDPDAAPDENPPHPVALSPFFLSKYELTQGQWLRFTGENPSYAAPPRSATNWSRSGLPVTLLHPVEQMSWRDCATVCARLGLVLPSEAQWEYAVRAGTSTPWWTGTDPSHLAEAGNVADQWAQKNGGPGGWTYSPWNDGWTVHAAAGTYAANPFGLHEMLGNVWEWCQDGYHDYRASMGRDPILPGNEAGTRVRRGGYYGTPPQDARSANRGNASESASVNDCGLRPARAIVVELGP